MKGVRLWLARAGTGMAASWATTERSLTSTGAMAG
jgi:hypothetical protein